MAEHNTDSGKQPAGNTLGAWIHVKHDVGRLIDERFQISKAVLKPQIERWRKVRNAYHGYVRDVQKRRGRANFHVHKLFPQIELESARFIVNYFQHDPFITVRPTKSESVESARLHERVVQFYLERCPVFYLEKLRLQKYTLLYGQGFEMPTWMTKKRKTKKTIPIAYKGVEVDSYEIETDETLYDGLWFKTWSPANVFPYPYATNLLTAPWVILVEFIRAQDLWRKAEEGIYDKSQVAKIPLNGFLQDEWEYKRQFTDLGLSEPPVDHELICLQHLFEADRFATRANGAVAIRDVDNFLFHNQIPLVQGVKTLDPDSFWNIGTGYNYLPVQKLANLFVNSMVDYVVSSLWPAWKHTEHVNPNDLLSLPNQKIAVKSMQDVEIIQMPEMKNDMIALLTIVQQMAEELTGYFGTQQGRNTGTQQTATSDTIFQQEGNLRISYDIQTFERLTLIPEAKQISSLIQQFMPDDAEIRVNGVAGAGFQRLGREEIQGEFEFTASGGSQNLNRAVVQQQLLEYFGLMADRSQWVQLPSGQLAPVPLIDAYNMAKHILEGYQVKNTDKLLYAPEVFGIPLNNDMLSAFDMPQVPGMDRLQPQPGTGALRGPGAVQRLRSMAGNVTESQLIQNTNKQATRGVALI